MAENADGLREDIAFMRDLAEAGASTPFLGGWVLIVVGAIFGTLGLVHWTWFQVDQPAFWPVFGMWIGGALVCWLVNYMGPVRRMRKKPGVRSPTNRASAWTWQSTGFSVNAILICGMVLAWRMGEWSAMAIFPSVVFAIYAAAWYVTMRMSQQGWMRWPVLGSLAFALALAYFAVTPYLFLVFATAMYLLVLLPGVVLVRREPSLVV